MNSTYKQKFQQVLAQVKYFPVLQENLSQIICVINRQRLNKVALHTRPTHIKTFDRKEKHRMRRHKSPTYRPTKMDIKKCVKII